MRMTKNKVRVLEALGFIDAVEGMYPPYNAVRLQGVLKDDLGYGDFDLPNLTRTLKALVDQGVVKCSLGPVDMSGTNGFVQRWFEQQRMKYWPADLDLAEMELTYKGTPEEQELKWDNAFRRLGGLPMLTMEEFRANNASKAAAHG
jgi:hypothetical protein